MEKNEVILITEDALTTKQLAAQVASYTDLFQPFGHPRPPMICPKNVATFWHGEIISSGSDSGLVGSHLLRKSIWLAILGIWENSSVWLAA